MKLCVAITALLLAATSVCDAFAGIPSLRRHTVDTAARKVRSVRPVRVRSVRVKVKAETEQGTSGDSSVQQAFVKPAFHNKNPVRVAAIVAATGLAAQGSLLAPGSLAKFVHMVSFAAWMGSTLWVTFIAGITMFRNMPRQTFGKIQAKLFPLYFLLHFCSIGAIFIIRGCPFRSRTGVTLLLSALFTLLNMAILEPNSTDIMMKRYKLEDEKKRDSEEYKSLGAQFGKYHGGSSLVNLLALLGAFVYAWDLGLLMSL